MKIEKNAVINNSLGINSRCKVLAKIETIDDLVNIEDLIKTNKKYYIQGEGTNIIPPSFYDGLIVKVELHHIKKNKNILSVGAAYNWTELVNFCIDEGINGFENLIDIPGSVGASPIQNIGAYGADVSKVIDSVDCFCLDTFSKKKLTNKECTFAYRDSAIKNSQYLIYNINFKTNLNKNISYKYSSIQKHIESNSINPVNLTTKDISIIISTIRSNVLPNPQFINNAGSFFKNPVIDKKLINFDNFTDDQLVIWNYSDTLVKVGAARLIQLIQDRIKPSPNVSIYKNHSLVLITNGKATQEEVLSYAAQINQLVHKTFNISLDIEPNIIK
tara:strand:- start:1534 stop:2526 length:993 start_codon:yes stop_codon:yes gene_type:complete